MRTTTNIWRLKENLQDDEAERAKFNNNRNAIYEAAAEIAGSDLYKEPISVEFSENGLVLTSVRAWPDLATAEAWVALCIEKNANELDNSLVSSVVDPE